MGMYFGGFADYPALQRDESSDVKLATLTKTTHIMEQPTLH